MAKKQLTLRLLLMLLVLTLPINTALAFAEINNVQVYGDAGKQGAVSSTSDGVYVAATVSEEIQANDLLIQFNQLGTHRFTNCIGVQCLFSLQKADRLPQEVSYVVKYMPQGVIKDVYNGLFVIDGMRPTIPLFTVEQDADDIEVTYKITDKACPSCQSCAGIKTISLYQDTTTIQTIEGNGGCNQEATIETTLAALNLAPGETQLCIEAEDYLNQKSQKVCKDIFVDREGPYFVPGSIKIIRINTDDEIHYTKGAPIPVTISIDIQDEDLNPATVRGDFTQLNAIVGDGYKDMPAACEKTEERTFSCLWTNIIVDGVTGQRTLQFSAKDNTQNEGIAVITYLIEEDKNPPEVVDIKIQQENQTIDFFTENLYLKQGINSLKIMLNPTGSAFQNKKVYVTLAAANVIHQQVNNCFQEAGQWACLLNITVPQTVAEQAQLQILGDTEDDAGNKLDQTWTRQVVLDTQKPVIATIEKSTICPTANDVLAITINATENSDALAAFTQPKNILNIQEQFSTLCTAIDEGHYTCELSLSNFVPYPEAEALEITLMDAAGNAAKQALQIQVCEAADVTGIDFLYVAPSEVTEVDKRTLSFMNYPVFVPLTIQRRAQGAEILQQTASCEGAASAYFVGSGIQSDLIVKVSQQTIAEDQLDIPCVLSFTMKKGLKVFTMPEQENITITIPLYGTPLGNVSDALHDKIASLTKDIDDGEERINALVKWNTILGWICIIAEGLGKLNVVIGAVKSATLVLGLIGEGLKEVPVTKALGEGLVALWTALCQVGNKFDLFVSKFIWPPGFGTGGIPIIKYGCIIYSGKLCDAFDGFTTGWGFAPRGDRYGYDSETGEVKNINQLPFLWDPYKSIHTARNCLFMSGIIYNMRKERQLSCMRRTCVEENAAVGLPISSCDIMYKERTCLYVESAQWKAMNMQDAGQVFANFMLNGFISKLEWFASSTGYLAARCPQALESIEQSKDSAACQAPKQYAADAGWYVACQLYSAALTIQETGGIKGFFPWTTKNMKAELPGTDYCT